MPARTLRKLLRAAAKPISIFVIPHGGLPSLRLNLPASVLLVLFISLLELFVAFLQAYVFTFLTAIFTGAAMHPH